MTVLIKTADDPHLSYQEFSRARTSGDEDALLIVSFTYKQYWLEDQAIELLAVYWFSGELVEYGIVQPQTSSMQAWETPQSDLESALSQPLAQPLAQQLAEWLVVHDARLFDLDEPLPLQTVSIPKPWGREIWYTGVEQRGVACFGDEVRCVPIPYLLQAMPSVLGQTESQSLMLLKILDPLSEEVFGDLYFELHREKQEVYVVTRIDPQAWPDGAGHMRMGFNAERIERAGGETEFRQQFLEQVLAYRNVRFQIDNLLDEKRKLHSYELNAEVPVGQLKQWLTEIPASLAEEEIKLRLSMESYFGALPLQTGDVVKVPLNVPHSLQHGVRTIEFQTPVYERRIIAFCQKVLTQEHWDTELGVEEMSIVPPSLPELPVLISEPGLRVEQVVDFSDFEVQRVALSASRTYHLESDVYQLLIVIEGALTAGKQKVTPEQAILVPPKPAGTDIQAEVGQQVTFLVATPSK